MSQMIFRVSTIIDQEIKLSFERNQKIQCTPEENLNKIG